MEGNEVIRIKVITKNMEGNDVMYKEKSNYKKHGME